MERTGEMKDGNESADQGDSQPQIDKQEVRDGEGEMGRGGDSNTAKTGDAAQENNDQTVGRDAQRSPDSKGKPNESNPTANQSGEKTPSGEKNEENEPQQTPGESQDRPKTNERDAGTGAEIKDDAKSEQQQPEGQKEQTKSPGGQQTATKGESGAGDEQKSQGAPNSQPDMKPAEKREQKPSTGEETNQEEPPAGARGKKESDSQGEQGGDRAGGGEEGGGQKAPRDGTGSAGQNQSADDGGGESAEKGAGSDSPNAGQDAVAEKKTGQSSGETTGRGSKTREVGGVQPEPGEKKDPSQEGGKPLHRATPTSEESKAANEGAKADPDSGKQGGAGENPPQDAKSDANQSGTPTGSGGQQGTTAMAPPKSTGSAPEGDEANLEYARKQTDLVLEKLSDQLNSKKIDQNMLKELGWSEDDLRRFVDRWRDRKKAAKRDDPSGDAAKRELDEALRSLGLRRGPMKQGQVKDDTLRDLREGYRGPVPIEYQERLRAYNQGVSRARAEVNDELPNDE
jgi:hypothetical protein